MPAKDSADRPASVVKHTPRIKKVQAHGLGGTDFANSAEKA